MSGSSTVSHSQIADAGVPSSPGQAKKDELAAEAVEYLLKVVTAPQCRIESPPETLSGIKNFETLLSTAWAVRNMSTALAGGNLEYSPQAQGITIGALKSLQSKLKRLTRQILRIAGADYGGKAGFIGECTEALTQMTTRLTQRITTLTQAGEEYRNMSFRDTLTGIYNRRAFMHFAETVFDTGRPEISTLIIADIDRFKNFNDTYGHLCGDEVLKLFSGHIAGALRQGDICCRYGGEEFLMLLPDMPLSSGLGVAERLRSGVEKLRLRFAGRELGITASFGVCEIGSKPANVSCHEFINSCISEADACLYKAKVGGRNMVAG